MKRFKEIRTEQGSTIFKVKDGMYDLTFVNHFNRISGTFLGVELKVMDDNWDYIRRNPWVLNADYADIRKSLKEAGFEKVEHFGKTEKEIELENSLDQMETSRL